MDHSRRISQRLIRQDGARGDTASDSVIETSSIFDDRGNPMSLSYANKKGVRYRAASLLKLRANAENPTIIQVIGGFPYLCERRLSTMPFSDDEPTEPPERGQA